MAEDDKVDTRPADPASEYRDTDSHLERFFSVETGLKIFNTLDSLAKRGKEGLEFALDLLSELSTELTGVKSFRVIPKPPMEVEVDIRFKKENTIVFRHLVAPLVELESVYFGKQINFEALIDSGQKGLKINLKEGFSVTINFGGLGKKTVEIKGSGVLKRDPKRGIVLLTSIAVPGLEEPLDITIPLTMIFHKNK